jgi:tRNA-dihydrouridine synthase A
VAEAMIAYVERETAAGARASSVLRHLVGLFHRVPGARAFRRHLSIASVKPGANAEVLRHALNLIRSDAALAETAAA